MQEFENRATVSELRCWSTFQERVNADNSEVIKRANLYSERRAFISSEAKGRRMVLDLKEVFLVAREAISFLERCEGDGVVLRNFVLHAP
jgi:hypothetical protein